MLTLYIVCAVVGLGLALIAAVMGDHDHDCDTHLDVSHELGHDHDTDSHLWLPFLSLRFWTYGFAGFGLTGILLTYLTNTPVTMIRNLAIGMGIACGLMIALLVRGAQKAQTHSGAGTKDMLGLEAQVLVAIRPGQPGKVRFSAKGDIIDMIAVSDDSQSVLETGTTAIVVAVEGDQARVVSREAIYEENVLARS